MPICAECGGVIGYRTFGGSKIAIEGKSTSFVPDPYTGTKYFVNRDGSIMKGRQVSDGQFGYLIHYCDTAASIKKAAGVGERI